LLLAAGQKLLNCRVTGFQSLFQLLRFVTSPSSHVGATAALTSHNSCNFSYDVTCVEPRGEVVCDSRYKRGFAVVDLTQHYNSRLQSLRESVCQLTHPV